MTSTVASGADKGLASNREEELYALARGLFAELGYTATTFDRIAKDLGIHKSSIFHYVATKQDLLAGVLGRGLGSYVERLREIVQHDYEDLADKLEAALLVHLDFVLYESELLRVFLRERKNLTGKRGDDYMDVAREYEQFFATIIEAGMAAGRFVEADASVTTKYMLGACNWMAEWYRPDGQFAADAIKESAVYLLVRRMLVK